MTKPFIKCVGGKRLLADLIIDHMPDRINTYVEPFLGGGAVFFRLQETGRLDAAGRVVLGEYDPDLVRLWRAVQSYPELLLQDCQSVLADYEADPEVTFYANRDAWNRGDRPAWRNLFLRYTTYNGLWRVSKTGNMNAPWGKYDVPKLPNLPRLREVEAALQGVLIEGGSYQRTIEVAPDYTNLDPYDGMVVYFDPPYDDGFVAYTDAGFSERDQRNLLVACADLAAKGATVLYTNADTPRVRGWLKDLWPDGTVHAITGKRTIAPTAAARGDAKEVLVTQ